ncbi:sister chromatid cohesion protein 1 [Sporothrix bragantina]|uniref:Sister chromatid cohesion protein 1 n=1 Tax=Sporothrix bragantina TaxID=671064 RepID=A0ABP0B5G5_9PEZI
MFYSETLLSKTGPLARVWLSANIERKLSKTHILQSNLQDSVEAIITPNQAPMALRLSGQLLLGVVRIYSRKARYLLDDCNEALMKIKMAFRSSGNNDLPANQQSSNRESLLLPDRITPYDNLDLLPRPDPEFFLAQLDEVTATPLSNRRAGGGGGRGNARDINLQEDFNNSQFLGGNFNEDDDLAIANKDDLELDLDFGLDFNEPLRIGGDNSVEVGRDAPAPAPFEDDMFDFDLEPRGGKDGADDTFADGVRIAGDDGDIRMDDDDMQFNLGEQSMLPGGMPDMSRARISESPLSDVDDDDVRQGELEFSRHAGLDMYDAGDSLGPGQVARRAPQRIKKTKVLESDAETMLAANVIREQQNNRENILKPQAFLPRDPQVLALMEMRKTNGFVSSIMLGGRSSTWAPELRGLLSFESIHGPVHDLKRKRDSGIADMDSDQDQTHSKSPRLDLGDDDHLGFDAGAAGDHFGGHSIAPDGTVLEMPSFGGDDDDDMTFGAGASNEDHHDVTVNASGPAVSLGTKHAVHILRDIFGKEAADDADKRKKSSAVFQQVLPEGRATKADATRMFFECLVLATKDAIKIEQASETLGGNIRLQSKRGLWGAWAERDASGNEEQDEEEEAAAAGNNVPSMSTAQVAVAA